MGNIFVAENSVVRKVKCFYFIWSNRENKDKNKLPIDYITELKLYSKHFEYL